MRTLIFLALFFSSLGLHHSAGAAAQRSPNIIFILADDYGWGDPAKLVLRPLVNGEWPK